VDSSELEDIFHTQAHMDLVAENVIEVAENANTIIGLELSLKPEQPRYFLGCFHPC
jgi:tryptophanase